MEVIVVSAVLVAAAALAVWRAHAEASARAEAEERAQREAAARAEAEERAQREAAARAEAEERAQREAAARAEAEERAQREAADRARAQERAKREIESRKEAEERAKAEARARRDAERRAARASADVAEARVDAVQRADEPTLVGALTRALPALDPERGRRLQNQIEALARLRADAVQLRKGLDATSDEEVRVQLRKRLEKVEHDAAALLQRLRNAVANDPALSGVKLSLAWEVRVSPSKTNNKKTAKDKEK